MRNYIVASWNNADSYEYSGEQIGNRQSKSQKVHFNPDGSACVSSYADPEPNKKAAVSIQDRILPQAKRVQTLTQQMTELVQEYKAGNMSIEEYSELLNIVSAKRDRAIVLLKKARSVKAQFNAQNSDDREEAVGHTQKENVVSNDQNPAQIDTLKGKNNIEGCVFFGASVLVCILMLIMSH